MKIVFHIFLYFNHYIYFRMIFNRLYFFTATGAGCKLFAKSVFYYFVIRLVSYGFYDWNTSFFIVLVLVFRIPSQLKKGSASLLAESCKVTEKNRPGLMPNCRCGLFK